jgi:predicted alpha/beta hydrolase family esterase
MARQGRSAAQALIEAALVMPVVVGLSLGVLQVVLYAHAHDVLVGAVQEGARLSAEDGRDLETGYARADTLVRAGLGSSVDPVHLVGSADDEMVAFRVDAALRPILPLPLIQALPIHAEGRVARERFRPMGGGG